MFLVGVLLLVKYMDGSTIHQFTTNFNIAGSRRAVFCVFSLFPAATEYKWFQDYFLASIEKWNVGPFPVPSAIICIYLHEALIRLNQSKNFVKLIMRKKSKNGLIKVSYVFGKPLLTCKENKKNMRGVLFNSLSLSVLPPGK